MDANGDTMVSASYLREWRALYLLTANNCNAVPRLIMAGTALYDKEHCAALVIDFAGVTLRHVSLASYLPSDPATSQFAASSADITLIAYHQL